MESFIPTGFCHKCGEPVTGIPFFSCCSFALRPLYEKGYFGHCECPKCNRGAYIVREKPQAKPENQRGDTDE